MNTKTTMKSLLAATAFGAVIPAAFAESSIAIDSVTQRWPWNNKVDITYTVTDGQSREAGVYAGVDFTIAIPGVGTQVVHGYEIGASAETGGEGSKRHTATWTAPAGVKATDCTVTATLFPTNVPSGNDYMVIDLSDGKVIYEGLMATQADSDTRYNTSAYKTTKMVLRKVPKWADAATLPNYGSTLAALSGYPTGHSGFNSGDSGSSEITSSGKNSRVYRKPDKDYYLSIFNLTVGQYDTVTGGSNTSDTQCKQGAGYNSVRNGGNETDVSYLTATNAIVANETGTFFQRLNYRTGFYFDYPTEVMHEIAARAGATTVYLWGDTRDGYADYAVDVNSGNTKQVATKKPNAWGFYDMCGLGYDYCLGSLRVNVGSGRPNLSEIDVFKPSTETRDPQGHPVKGGGAFSQNITEGTYAGTFRASHRGVIQNTRGNGAYRVAYIVE